MSTATPRSRGLASRLVIGQCIVLIAGALATGLVAALVGPRLFHQHLIEAGLSENAPGLVHIEMAYRDASMIAIGLGLVVSVLAAGVVTWILTQRLRRPLAILTTAADELSRGHYGARAEGVASHTELDTLAETFNTMAARLEGTEDTRRRMLADLAHEMRTPIMTLTAFHDGLLDGVAPLDAQTRRVLADQTGRLARLADDIKDVSSAEEGALDLHSRNLGVARLLAAAADTQRAAFAGSEVTLIVESSNDDLVVRGDPDRLAQVLANLLGNALRHTGTGGKVVLGARKVGDDIAITVADTGDGIPSEQMAHIFERFYRGDSARTRDAAGSGIGLTISKVLVDAHGGSITAASQGLGRGAVFTIVLPG